MNTENRSRSRRYIDTSIKVLEGIGCYHNAIGSDVSLGGLCFITTKPNLKEGQTIMIQFDLPIKGRLVNVHGEAKIMYKTSYGSSAFKIGLKFVSLDALSIWNVTAYLNSINHSFLAESSEAYPWNSLSAFSYH
ncbi:MAG: PilZ domain-containing protein [Pseudomonadota bacterium]